MTMSPPASPDIFIADEINRRVLEVPGDGGPQLTLGSRFVLPNGVAVDASGNLFVVDLLQSVGVVEVPAGGGPQTKVGTGLVAPSGVAFDTVGDVFIADYGGNQVVEVPAGGGPQITIGAGLSSPGGVAVDGAGDVFIADSGNSRVVERPAGEGAQITVGTGLNRPFGVAVDVPVTHSTYGAPVRLTATVQTSPAGGVPTSNVAFTDGLTSLGEATVSDTTSVSPTLTTTALCVGTHRITAFYGGDPGHATSSASSPMTVVVAPGIPTTPTITDIPAASGVGAQFAATVATTGDGTRSVTSNSPEVCKAGGLEISFVGAGTCSLTAHVAAGSEFAGASGSAQTFIVVIPVPGCSSTGVGCAASPSGYWIATAMGAVCSCGDAPFYGSLATLGVSPVSPSVGMAASPDGKGYWLVASDGGLFAFGDASFYGSMDGGYLNDPVVGIPSTPDGGYYEVASDGGVFNFGNAIFVGSLGGQMTMDVVGDAIS